MQSDFGYFEEKQLGKPYDINLLRRLFPFVRVYRRQLITTIVLVIAITLLELSLPMVTKLAIDRFIVPQPVSSTAESNVARDGDQHFIEVDLANDELVGIVADHPDVFRISGARARIALDDLSRLPVADRRAVRQKDIDGLGWITLLFLVIILADFGLNYAQRIVMEYTGHRIMHGLRMQLYTHMQTLSVDFFSRNPVGRLVTRLTNDVQNMHELFTSMITFVFKDVILLLGISTVLLVLNWKLALVTFTILPPVVFASVLFSIKARHIFRVLRIKIAQINTHFSETIAGIRVIQLYNHIKSNADQFKSLNRENYLAGIQQINIMAVFMPIIEMLGVLAIAVVIYYGGGRVLIGSLSLGALVAFISYIKMFFRPIRDLAEKYNLLQNAMASAERIFLIFDHSDDDPTLPLSATAGPPRLAEIRRIDFENVDFSYVAGETVLENLSFTIRSGETLAVVGPTGAGKTTLLNLLVGFHPPTSGRIRINQTDLRDIDPADFRSKLALVMQEPFLFSETIADNIFRGITHQTPGEIDRVLKLSNCHEMVARLPHGLQTRLSEGGTSISSGQRQLLSIARAFARSPQLILFDEATSYIDSQTEQQIQSALDQLMQQRTAVIIAHRLSTIQKADRILVLNRGRVIESGSHTDLMDRKGFYYRLQQFQTA